MTLAAPKPLSCGEQLAKVFAALLAGGAAGAGALGIVASLENAKSIGHFLTDFLINTVMGLLIFGLFTVAAALIFGLPGYFILKRLKLLNLFVICIGGTVAGIIAPLLLITQVSLSKYWMPLIVPGIVAGLTGALVTFHTGKWLDLKTSAELAKQGAP